ncbi:MULTISPECIES: helix-turn-helix transcriptional regulator [Parabacteroides]|uniref:helix-turn-helix domain-containing protein n=1 Tax=Parabacteroides leei TaxID=2939491 RepID=UPI001899FEFC|nr:MULTISPECIES: helix-turn-helix transcriptional regulator [Parabacteroides]MCL3851853.1 helix-turn-helix transcriptional regulator [Parabacteroides leei]
MNKEADINGKQRGAVSIERLNRELGVNYKWLERNFSEKLGITPKTYISLQRFINAYVSLLEKKEDLTDIAVNNGYSDTNHFIKDFRKYTGQTPIQYLRMYKEI